MLDRPTAPRKRQLSERERRRLALEAMFERAITTAKDDPTAAFVVELDGEKPATVRLSFNRVRDRLGSVSVNLFARSGQLFIANRPQTRGRRRTS